MALEQAVGQSIGSSPLYREIVSQPLSQVFALPEVKPTATEGEEIKKSEERSIDQALAAAEDGDETNEMPKASLRYHPLPKEEGAIYQEQMEGYAAGGTQYQDSLVYGGRRPLAEEEEETKARPSDTESETMTREEAEEAVVDIQYAAVFASNTVDNRTRERLAIYAQFDSSLFGLLDRFSRLTNDIDYSKMF